MEVTLLGTGSIYSKSNCASLIIDNNILVDLGPGTIKQLLKQNYNLKNIDSILITHLHSDHILDFPTLIVNLEALKINHKINIYSPKETKTKLFSLLNIMYGNYFDNFIKKNLNFINIFDNKIFNIKGHIVECISVVHTGIESYGFIIDSKLGISGDSSLCNGIKKIYNNSKILICDCSLIKGNIYHIGIDNIQKLLKLDYNKKIILTHLREDTKKCILNMSLSNVLIVEDGYKFSMEG